MTQGLWRRNVWNGRSKGLSTVIGTVFLTLVVFAISTNVFLWTISKNAEYYQAVKDENQGNVDRLNENIIATDANYSVLSGSKVNVEAKLRNVGSVWSQIVSLWVLARARNETTKIYGFNNTLESLDLKLNPGDSIRVSVNVIIQNISATYEFHSWFVTARGNVVEVRRMYDVVSELISQGGVGPMVYNFYEFRYFLYESDVSDRLMDYPNGMKSFHVPNDEGIALGVKLTNLDALCRSMSFKPESHIWVASDKASMNQWKRFYIVNVSSDGTVASTYNDIVLQYGKTALLIFASDGALVDGETFGKQNLPKSHFGDNTVSGTYLLVYGYFDGTLFAQNVPFVSFFIT